MVFVRLFELETTGVHGRVHLPKLVLARPKRDVDYVGSRKHFDSGQIDLKRLKVMHQRGYTIARLFGSSRDLARRQHRDVRAQETVRNQLLSEPIQKPGQRIGYIANESEKIDRIP